MLNHVVQQVDSLTEALEQSRSELLELSARVQRLIGKRERRQVLLQRLRRGASIPTSLQMPSESHYLCSLCATSFASRAILNVRSPGPGQRCDCCGQPAIVWLELKCETEDEHVAVAHYATRA
ncbi:MAG TPA: hypothetical protein VM680_09440 [Verrucomicrobiae bacterium]|nr:hypothetical protein [Verrucomicrobiae bacterium]